MVVIKDFQMPKNCGDCTLNSCVDFTCFYCDVTINDVDICGETRPADCPLMEVEVDKIK